MEAEKTYKWAKAYEFVWGRGAKRFVKVKKEEPEDEPGLASEPGMAQPVY